MVEAKGLVCTVGGFGGFEAFSGMGGAQNDKKKALEPEKVAYIEFVGYIITKTDKEDATAIYRSFKDRLEKCGLFEAFTIDDNDRTDRNFKLAEIGANISSFKIEAKLKESFEK